MLEWKMEKLLYYIMHFICLKAFALFKISMLLSCFPL